MEVTQDTGHQIYKKFGRVGVLMGGPSSERDISIKSGTAVYHALCRAGVDAVPVDIPSDDREAVKRIIKEAQLDCAFLVLHGYFGEDGQIQGILDDLRLPYTGSGKQASQVSMDKVTAKEILAAGGITLARQVVIRKDQYHPGDIPALGFGFPVVVKPATHGSSIGLSIVENAQGLAGALAKSFAYDTKVLIEEWIKGRELTVAILDSQALPIIEIVPKNKVFDFEAKYTAGMTEYLLPAPIDEALSRKVQQAALRTHELLGCSGASRVDVIIDEAGRPYVLEINTIPGFTATSLLPKAAKAAGIEFEQLCVRLIELAYEKAAQGVEVGS